MLLVERRWDRCARSLGRSLKLRLRCSVFIDHSARERLHLGVAAPIKGKKLQFLDRKEIAVRGSRQEIDFGAEVGRPAAGATSRHQTDDAERERQGHRFSPGDIDRAKLERAAGFLG